jgi:hypothetical protein
MGSSSQSSSINKQSTAILPSLESAGMFASPDSLITSPGSLGIRVDGTRNVIESNLSITGGMNFGMTGAEVEKLLNTISSRDAEVLMNVTDNISGSMAGISSKLVTSQADLAKTLAGSQSGLADTLASAQSGLANALVRTQNDFADKLALAQQGETGEFAQLLKQFGVFLLVLAGAYMFLGRKK